MGLFFSSKKETDSKVMGIFKKWQQIPEGANVTQMAQYWEGMKQDLQSMPEFLQEDLSKFTASTTQKALSFELQLNNCIAKCVIDLKNDDKNALSKFKDTVNDIEKELQSAEKTEDSLKTRKELSNLKGRITLAKDAMNLYEKTYTLEKTPKANRDEPNLKAAGALGAFVGGFLGGVAGAICCAAASVASLCATPIIGPLLIGGLLFTPPLSAAVFGLAAVGGACFGAYEGIRDGVKIGKETAQGLVNPIVKLENEVKNCAYKYQEDYKQLLKEEEKNIKENSLSTRRP